VDHLDQAVAVAAPVAAILVAEAAAVRAETVVALGRVVTSPADRSPTVQNRADLVRVVRVMTGPRVVMMPASANPIHHVAIAIASPILVAVRTMTANLMVRVIAESANHIRHAVLMVHVQRATASLMVPAMTDPRVVAAMIANPIQVLHATT
jgi:hypothetical protein